CHEVGAQAFDAAQSRRRSSKSIRGRARTPPGPRGPRGTLASNNSEGDRGKAHRAEISQRDQTNLASQRRRAMTSVETSDEVPDQAIYQARVSVAYDHSIGLVEERRASESREHYARRGPGRLVNSVRVPGWRAPCQSPHSLAASSSTTSSSTKRVSAS